MPESLKTKSLKIMVVDDDPVTLEVTRAVLVSLGHEVVTRELSIGTTAAILRERPRVVLLDIRMPGLSGNELLKAIREEDLLGDSSRTDFILYSGLDADELRQHVEETGALGAIEKTPDPTAFAAALEAILERL